MARERATEEFVRHYGNVVELTANNPDRLVSALDAHPGLAASLRRLGEIVRLVDQHRRYQPHRYITRAPTGFRAAFEDFKERWIPAYNECRDRMYMQALSRISEAFLRGYDLIIKQTDNDPSAVERLRATDPELDDACNELGEIRAALDEHRQEFGRFINRAPHEFCAALSDVNARWADAIPSPLSRAVASIEL